MTNPYVKNKTVYLPFTEKDYNFILAKKKELVEKTGEDITLNQFIRTVLLEALRKDKK